MRRQIVILFILYVLLSSSSFVGRTDDEGKMRFRFQIFILTGSLLELSDADEIFEEVWNGDDDQLKLLKKNIQIFDAGYFRFGSDKLRIRKDGMYWNNQIVPFEENLSFPFPTNQIHRIYSPIVFLDQNELSTIKIDAQQSYQYFTKREDALFELKELELPTGLEITVRPKEREDRARLDNMKISIRSVSNRDVISGVSLDVGKPILTTQEYDIRLKTEFNKMYAILFHLENNP